MSVHNNILRLSIVASLLAILALLRQSNLSNTSATEWHRGLQWTNSTLAFSSRKWSGLGHWRPITKSPESEHHMTLEQESNLTRTLVIPRMMDEDISWIAQELPNLDVSAYVANDPSTLLHSPKNKGHEVMVYLTYIIDHYDDLPDIVIFMHAHRWAHHNTEFLGYDAPQMIKRLSNRHVIQHGYVNLRCNWSPGCPEWLHPPHENDDVIEKQEEAVLAESWDELFPTEPLPATLAQPCCAQFALSRSRIQSLPLSRFIFFRDWILRTPLSDYVSGRIWEYSWQYLFTAQGVACPPEHVCYCDTFRLCFGGASQLDSYKDLQQTKLGYEKQMHDMKGGWSDHENAQTKSQESDSFAYLRRQVDALNQELAGRKKAALDRGRSFERDDLRGT